MKAVFTMKRDLRREVSVLFSEPKIPQLRHNNEQFLIRTRFSALQRAENSSMRRACNAAEIVVRFSALQRAENSSIEQARALGLRFRKFQCSSASRKFLNPETDAVFPSDWAVSVLFSEPKIPQWRN